jgi:hypothetical protein
MDSLSQRVHKVDYYLLNDGTDDEGDKTTKRFKTVPIEEPSDVGPEGNIIV